MGNTKLFFLSVLLGLLNLISCYKDSSVLIDSEVGVVVAGHIDNYKQVLSTYSQEGSIDGIRILGLNNENYTLVKQGKDRFIGNFTLNPGSTYKLIVEHLGKSVIYNFTLPQGTDSVILTLDNSDFKSYNFSVLVKDSSAQGSFLWHPNHDLLFSVNNGVLEYNSSPIQEFSNIWHENINLAGIGCYNPIDHIVVNDSVSFDFRKIDKKSLQVLNEIAQTANNSADPYYIHFSKSNTVVTEGIQFNVLTTTLVKSNKIVVKDNSTNLIDIRILNNDLNLLDLHSYDCSIELIFSNNRIVYIPVIDNPMQYTENALVSELRSYCEEHELAQYEGTEFIVKIGLQGKGKEYATQDTAIFTGGYVELSFNTELE